MKISVNLNFTTSKFLAYLIFFVGSALAFYLKDSSIFINSVTASALLSGVKTVSETVKRKEE